MSSQPFTPNDERLRSALTHEARPGLADAVFADLSAALEAAPQVRRRVPPWLDGRGASAVGPSRATRVLRTAGVLAVAAIVILGAVLAVGLVGSRHRLPSPFGLARSGLLVYDSNGQIFTANADGSGPRQITSGATRAIAPTASGDGTRIAYEALDPRTGYVALFVCDIDGSNARQIATIDASPLASGPQVAYPRIAWSPDGGRLAYTAPIGARSQVIVIKADGSGKTTIGPVALEGHDPAWSPDATRIAFYGGQFDTERGIYVMSADGSGGYVQITPPDAQPWDMRSEFSPPVWSPRGDLIAYSNFGSFGESHIFVVSPDGGPPTDLTTVGNDDWAPAWSPDGSRIAWRRGPVGQAGELGAAGQFVIGAPDAPAVSAVVLTPSLVDGTPVWSPDGTRLIGHADDVDSGQPRSLVIIPIDGGPVIDVPAQPAGDPSWQRLAP